MRRWAVTIRPMPRLGRQAEQVSHDFDSLARNRHTATIDYFQLGSI